MAKDTPAPVEHARDESIAVVRPEAGATVEAYFEVSCGRGAPPFILLVTGAETAAHAQRVVDGQEKEQVLLKGKVVAGPAAYNPVWTFHVDPATVEFVSASDPGNEAHAATVERKLEDVGTEKFLPGRVWSPSAGEAKLVRALAKEDVDAELQPGNVLAEELEYIGCYRASLGRARPARPEATTAESGQKALFAAKAAALCLSGGGIRSATFNLGVLQGLAKKGALDQFDYVSTVSGGGYIGGWLSAWAFRAGHLSAILPVLQKDSGGVLHAALKSRSPIEWLRDFSNYLSPKVGVFSVDTWTLVATYVRNLFVIWLAIIPPLMLLLGVPRILMHLMNTIPEGRDWGPAAQTAIIAAAGSLLLIYGEYYSYKLNGTGVRQRADDYLLRVNVAFMVGVVLMSWAWIVSPKADNGISIVPMAAAVTLLVAAIQGCFMGDGPKGWSWTKFAAPVLQLVVMTTNFLVLVALTFEYTSPLTKALSWQYVVFPVFLLYALLVGDLVYIAFTSRITTDEDRERWARSGAWFAILAIGWLFYTGIALLAPLVLWDDQARPNLVAHGVNAAGAFVLGIVLALVGRGSGNKEKLSSKGSALRRLALPAAMALFVVLVLALLASGFYAIERMFIDAPPDGVQIKNLLGREHDPVPVGGAAIGLLLLVAICALVLYWVNINHFSLHAMYRDRLLRAYLGAARSSEAQPDARFEKEPPEFGRFAHGDEYKLRWRNQGKPRQHNPYTGFDVADNPDLFWLGIHGKQPLWLVNMALNISPGERHLSWQERQAATFTASPLHCGSWLTGYRRTWAYGDPQGGLSCGTAMAVSGAAANPNMGYHSSPALTFLMTFFNVRLGWWLGNPRPSDADRRGRVHRERGPRQGLWQLIRELFGKVDENSRWIHLSDGGHFENLGLYEVVLRRCRYVVVCDASADPRREFEDLGNAIRKIRTDLHVSIEPRDGHGWHHIGPRSQASPVGHAVFDIKYSDDESEWGQLLYIKPSVYNCDARLPPDVRQYAKGSASFPHEPTTDQFFTESQFESYRALGEYQIVHQVLAALDPKLVKRDGLDPLFRQAEKNAKAAIC